MQCLQTVVSGVKPIAILTFRKVLSLFGMTQRLDFGLINRSDAATLQAVKLVLPPTDMGWHRAIKIIHAIPTRNKNIHSRMFIDNKHPAYHGCCDGVFHGNRPNMVRIL